MNYLEQRNELLYNLREGILKVSSYATYPDYVMVEPIALNKRSVYEIVAHLMIWDSFILKKRLPQLLHQLEFTEIVKEAILVEKVSEYTKKHLPIEVFLQFIEVRRIFLQQLEKLSEEEWLVEFIVREVEVNLLNYIAEITKHDQHHFKQIETFLSQNPVKLGGRKEGL